MKQIAKSKRSVSEMVAYVLLIVIAISISIIVYSYLNSVVIKKTPVCPEDTSLIIGDYSCAGTILNLTVKNNGYFSLDGFIVQISNDTKNARFVLEEKGKSGTNGEVYFVPRLNSSGEKNMLFDYTKYRQVTKIEIKPFIFETKRIICETAIITQEITGCGEEVVITEPACSESNCTAWGGGVCDNGCGSLKKNETRTCDAGCEYLGVSRCVDDSSCVSGGPAVTQPVSWWRFENNGNDEKGLNGLSLTSGTSYAAGKVGQALLSTDTARYAFITPMNGHENLQLTKNFTIESWININQFSTSAYVIGEINKTGNYKNYQIAINDKGNIILYWGNLQALVSVSKLSTNIWYYLAVTKNNSEFKLYIDNALDNSAIYSAASPVYAADDVLKIGVLGNIGKAGLTDEVAVYNETLSKETILTHYQNTATGTKDYFGKNI